MDPRAKSRIVCQKLFRSFPVWWTFGQPQHEERPLPPGSAPLLLLFIPFEPLTRDVCFTVHNNQISFSIHACTLNGPIWGIKPILSKGGKCIYLDGICFFNNTECQISIQINVLLLKSYKDICVFRLVHLKQRMLPLYKNNNNKYIWNTFYLKK